MNQPKRRIDRVEAFASAVDAYEPTRLANEADLFRSFARALSRAFDGRYLSKHPADELIPTLESLMETALYRQDSDVMVEVQAHPSDPSRAILMSCVDDRPFIVSSILHAIHSCGAVVTRNFNAIALTRRDTTGRLTDVSLTGGTAESFTWLEFTTTGMTQSLTELKTFVSELLTSCAVVTSDYDKLRIILETAADYHEANQERANQDVARFIRWLLQDHFLIIGLRHIDATGAVQQSLGSAQLANSLAMLSAASQEELRFNINPNISLRKTSKASWLYRRAQVDFLTLKLPGDTGEEFLEIEGLFTYHGLRALNVTIPCLDRLAEELFKKYEVSEGTHRYRSIRNAYNSLPIEYLFELPLADLQQVIEQMVEGEKSGQVEVHATPTEQEAFIFVVLPKTYYSEDLRHDVQKLLRERLSPAGSDYGTFTSDSDTMGFHFFLTGLKDAASIDWTTLLEDVKQLAHPWTERLAQAIHDRFDASEATEIERKYREAFPSRYREETSVSRAIQDIQLLEGLSPSAPFTAELFRQSDDKNLGLTRLRIFEEKPTMLSSTLPVLDNLGFEVLNQYPTSVTLTDGETRVISTFRLRPTRDLNVDLLTRRNRLSAAIKATLSGVVDNDSFNRLLLKADIPWTYVDLMRAYFLYMRQLGSSYDADATRDVLEKNASIVQALTELFRVKFDPSIAGLSSTEVCDKRKELIARASQQVEKLIDAVSDLTSDLLLRQFYNLINSTLRTNFYRGNPMQGRQLVLKLDPNLIERAPEPRPYREIFVHHPYVSGLHLRGGPVARGGIRWSDRRTDFRAEVLGLMDTQNLKNVVIVPRGAKGAFIARRHIPAGEDPRPYGKEAYTYFINGLLEVTDNLVDGKVTTPEFVLRYDDLDHYLVVAADKGTATLSDTSNSIAQERGFWLGDAFASGGSKGYDHKVDGITAKGAWECTKRHFKELDIDPEVDEITVVGIGDMSGDVFGNGLLRSQSAKLLAAFDHRHIFLDPNPDPAKSYQARSDLFEKGPSCWEDYPKELISKGGGVYPRGSKAIELSLEVQKALGTTASSLSGPELIQAVLRAPVDLLWNGGIGTYVKASTESQAEAGDPSNTSVRIDATEVRAQVIGEGGNLGLTPKGRIQLSERGVRLNTDAIDNSGGVDLSDHEVNIKILLERPLGRKEITPDERDDLLNLVRPGVNRTVLQNNWIQSRSLSLDEARSSSNLNRFIRTIDHLSKEIPFLPSAQNMPSDSELAHRNSKGAGLYRPELAVLTSFSKLYLRRGLAAGNRFRGERVDEHLLRYFEPELIEKFRDDVLNHPLRDDIAQMMIVNQIVGDGGASIVSELIMQSGATTEDVAEAYLEASRLLNATQLKKELDRLESELVVTIEYRIRLSLDQAIERLAALILRGSIPRNDKFADTFQETLSKLAIQTPGKGAKLMREQAGDLESSGFSKEHSTQLAAIHRLDDIIAATRIALRGGASVDSSIKAMFTIGEHSHITPLLAASKSGAHTSPLAQPARAALREQIQTHLVFLALDFMKVERDLDHISDESTAKLQALADDLDPLYTEGQVDLSALVLAVDRIGRRRHRE